MTMRMLTTLDLMDLAKTTLAARHNLPLPVSDYRLALLMDIPEGTISNWRRGKTGIGPERAVSFADATDLPVEFVYACIEHERSDSSEVKCILENIAGQFYRSGTAASLLLALVLFAAAPNFAHAHENPAYSPPASDANSYRLYTFGLILRLVRRCRRFATNLLSSMYRPSRLAWI